MNQRTHTEIAVQGMSWVLLNTVVSRGIVFLSQLVLGYLLAPSDFGTYALALSITNALSALRNGGTPQILFHRGSKYGEILSASTQYSLIFNLLALLALVAITPLADTSMEGADIGLICIAIGLSFPLGTFATVFRCELQLMGRFRDVAILNTASTVLWQAEVIVLATLGFGPYSYAIPMVLQSLVDGILGWCYIKKWPITGKLIGWRQFTSLFVETRWIMLGAAMLSLGLTGHYFAAGLHADAGTVGFFFFGFQIAYTIFIILNNAIESVLPPMLGQLNDDKQQQSKVVMDMLSILLVVSIPVAGVVAVASSSVVHILWGGRWDASAVVVTNIAFSIPAWVLIAIARAMLEARGMWRFRLLLLTVYGIGTVAVVAAAAASADVGKMSFCLSAFYVILSLVVLGMLPHLMATGIAAPVAALISPLVVSMFCWLTAHEISTWILGSTSSAQFDAVETLVFIAALLVANIVVFGSTWKTAIRMVRGKAEGRSGA